MQYNEDMIRDFLLNRILNKHDRIKGIIESEAKGNRQAFKNNFNDIMRFFANGLDGDVMTQIYEHKMDHKDRNATYHYFDIDTLVAYNKFLERILFEAGAIAYNHDKSGRISMKDFLKGFEDAKKVWSSLIRERSSQNGYYNKSKPVGVITTRKKGVTELSPKQPLNNDAFLNKYEGELASSFGDVLKDADKKKKLRYLYGRCDTELLAYLEMKHNGRDIFATSEVPKKRSVYRFDYMGRTLELDIVSQEYYTDIEGKGLTSIVAEGREGRLYTTNYNDGRVYDGDLYDRDGNLVEVDGGGQVFYENKSFLDAIRKRKGVSTPTSDETPYQEGDDGQMFLF